MPCRQPKRTACRLSLDRRSKPLVEPATSPGLQRVDRRLQGQALLRQQVLDARRVAVQDDPVDDALGLELLQPLREEAVRQIGHALLDLREARGSLEQDRDDRPGPALAYELYCLVV